MKRSINAIGCLLFCIFPLASYAQNSASAPAPGHDSKFLRFVQDPDGSARLEASVVSYHNDKYDADLDLIAAIHVADASFFRELDQSFTKYDSLLYELVKPRGMVMTSHGGTMPSTGPAAATTMPRRSRSLNWVGTFQRFLKDKLDLSFQLEEIDYSRPNFVHADLDAETFEQMQEDRGESIFTLMLQQMFREMARDASGATRTGPQPNLMDIVVAMQSPDRVRQVKLVLAREFGAIDEMAGGLDGGGKGSVIVTERNKAALRVLQQRLDAGDKKIGIFYGAAHLKTMEETLTHEMGFKQVGEPVWRTAWDVGKKTTPTTQP